MTKQHLLFLTITLAAAAAACAQDPNKNSQIFMGTGGTTGTGTGGSSGGSGGGGSIDPNGPIKGGALATFNSTDEGFVLNQFDEMPNLVKHNNGTAPSVMFDPSQGSPSPGSLVVQAPFFAANQYVDVQKSFGTSTPIDLSGRTLYVRVKVTQGTFPGGAQVYVNTTSGYVFGGTFTNAGRNSNWQEFKMDVNNPMTKGMPSANYDPTHVVQIGVQLNNGTGATNASPVTFNIDSFSVDPPLPGSTTDGGGGAAGGSGGATGDGAASDGTSN